MTVNYINLRESKIFSRNSGIRKEFMSIVSQVLLKLSFVHLIFGLPLKPGRHSHFGRCSLVKHFAFSPHGFLMSQGFLHLWLKQTFSGGQLRSVVQSQFSGCFTVS